MASTYIQDPSRRASRTYFEEYGLRVPLLKLGQKRLYARSVDDLATKSKQGLAVIVKAYAPAQGPKIVKSLVSKTALAEWIERVETLAFGAHPESKLPSTKKADIIEALGLNASAPKAKGNKGKKDTPSGESHPKKAKSSPEDNKISSSRVSPFTDTAKSKATPKRTSVESTVEIRQVTHNANKRKCDSAAAPFVQQMLLKKTKTEAAPSSDTTFSPRKSTSLVLDAVTAEKEAPASSPPPRQASEDRVEYTEMIDATFLTIGHAEPQEPIKPVLEPDLNKECLNPIRSDQYHATKIDEAIHFTFIPANYDGDSCRKRPSTPKTFLKLGLHGRQGDFVNDPDLLTGRGHQVDPSDLKLKREYEAKYHTFYTDWPFWPFVDKERGYPGSEYVEGKKELDEAERWMLGYRERYPGEVVGHLWACGCEVPRDEDESEEE